MKTLFFLLCCSVLPAFAGGPDLSGLMPDFSGIVKVIFYIASLIAIVLIARQGVQQVLGMLALELDTRREYRYQVGKLSKNARAGMEHPHWY